MMGEIPRIIGHIGRKFFQLTSIGHEYYILNVNICQVFCSLVAVACQVPHSTNSPSTLRPLRDSYIAWNMTNNLLYCYVKERLTVSELQRQTQSPENEGDRLRTSEIIVFDNNSPFY